MVIHEFVAIQYAKYQLNCCCHLEIEDEITDDEFAKMIDDPELYGLIWEDYLIMTENVEELLLETEYDEFDLEKAAKELSEMWENFDIDAFNAIEN